MDYNGKCRSNYFKVKDGEKFESWCTGLYLKPINSEKGHSFTSENSVPSDRDEDGEMVEIDFYGELAEHLEEGEVAVVMEIGSEGMRYLVGGSTAVNSKGETVHVSLEDIYQKAEKLGNNITKTEY